MIPEGKSIWEILWGDVCPRMDVVDIAVPKRINECIPYDNIRDSNLKLYMGNERIRLEPYSDILTCLAGEINEFNDVL